MNLRDRFPQITKSMMVNRKFDEIDIELLNNGWAPFGTSLWTHKRLPRLTFKTKTETIAQQQEWDNA